MHEAFKNIKQVLVGVGIVIFKIPEFGLMKIF